MNRPVEVYDGDGVEPSAEKRMSYDDLLNLISDLRHDIARHASQANRIATLEKQVQDLKNELGVLERRRVVEEDSETTGPREPWIAQASEAIKPAWKAHEEDPLLAILRMR